MTNRLASAIVLACCLLAASTAGAQGLCRPLETVAACVNRVRSDTLFPDKDALAADAKTEQKQAAKKTETSLESVSGLSSSVKDFLPLLQLGGVLGSVQKDDQSGLVSVALNTPFAGSSGTGKKDNALQVKAVIDTTAKLFEPLKKQLPEKGRDEAAKDLVSAKTDAENVALQASYNFSSRRLGRNFEQHKDTLDALFAEALKAVANPRDAWAESLATLVNTADVDFTKQWRALTRDQQEAVEDGVTVMLAAEKKFNAALAGAIKAKGLDVYGQLVTNQPQFQVTLSKAFRDDLFGPDLVSGRVAFEMGLGNSLNAALGAYNGSCPAHPAECLATYASFAANAERRAAIKAGSRLSAYFEFVNNDAYHFTKADPALDLTIAEGTGWTAGLDYGRLIAVNDAGEAGGRVDGSIRWEAPSDKELDRRFVASITVTKKLGELSVPFGLVYANKEKFLTGIDKGLSAHVGLKFNLFPGLN